MNRILSAARLQLLAWPFRLGWPWLILTISFSTNLLVFAAIGDLPGDQITGGIAAIYLGETIFCGQTITQIFPFALGLSVTRRSFYVATMASLVARSLLFALGLLALKLIEDATDGWGMSMRFFNLPVLGQDNPALQWLAFALPFVVLSLAAVVGAVAFVRWGLNGVFTLITAVMLTVAGVASLIAWQHQWGNLARWFADEPRAVTVLALPALFAVVLAVAGYLGIRRTTAPTTA